MWMRVLEARDECACCFGLGPSPARTHVHSAGGRDEERLGRVVCGVGLAGKGSRESVALLLERPNRLADQVCKAHTRELGVVVKPLVVGPLKARVTRTGRDRPAPGGVSVGHYAITAGTIGCWVEDRRGQVCILSNNHVLANTNRASPGDAVLQPGRFDGGRAPRDTIATLSEFVTISPTARNRVDAAVAKAQDPADVDRSIFGIGSVTGTAQAAYGMLVRKSGRTTGVRSGQVRIVGAIVRISYGQTWLSSAVFDGQFLVTPGTFSAGGDSGSLVVDSRNRAVGLLFAGSPSYTVCNRIQDVVAALGIRSLSPAGAVECPPGCVPA